LSTFRKIAPALALALAAATSGVHAEDLVVVAGKLVLPHKSSVLENQKLKGGVIYKQPESSTSSGAAQSWRLICNPREKCRRWGIRPRPRQPMPRLTSKRGWIFPRSSRSDSAPR